MKHKILFKSFIRISLVQNRDVLAVSNMPLADWPDVVPTVNKNRDSFLT